ncbi:MAG: pseudouridine-5'-phosphate glycosidase [Actinomycetota bacterium]|jgi:pseudouridine-5'-phosphate glycosidase
MSSDLPFDVLCSDEVTAALAEGRPVVALETTIISHGLPHPVNLDVARECEAAVRESGAVPATIGILHGQAIVGLSDEHLTYFADPDAEIVKVSTRDLGIVMARGLHGATTVAATLALAEHLGIWVMATGGLGGVHRGAGTTFDESADLAALARSSVVVVASGCKSILDIGATLERLDTLGVAVMGYQTGWMPGFYLHQTEFALDWRVETPQEVVAAFAIHQNFADSALLVAHPVPVEAELDRALHDAALAEGLERVARGKVLGKDVTPVLLSAFAELTAGRSVETNRRLVVGNARLAGLIASCQPE